ncbi:MAG: hypothetical protein AAF202_03025 [Pseudomonadota bacterium]
MDQEIEFLDDGPIEELSPDQGSEQEELGFGSEDANTGSTEDGEIVFDADELDAEEDFESSEEQAEGLVYEGDEEDEILDTDSRQQSSVPIGVRPSEVAYEEVESEVGEILQGPPNGQGGYVVVEPIPPLVYSKSSKASLLPYRERRQRWSVMGSLGYSWYLPVNYEPTVGAFAEYSDLYSENPKGPLLEVQFTMKRNFGFASIGFDAGAGVFSVDSRVNGVDSTLDINMYRAGLTIILDTLFSEPWVAPYFSGGGYVIQKKESIDATSDNESTQVAPYYAFGLLFQLDWIDSRSALNAYSEIGLENTYIFAEGRQLISSSAEADSDFSTDIFATAGFRVEL